MSSNTSRIAADLPVVDAREAAATIPSDATLLVSGFSSVGYPKAVPRALVADDRELSLTIVSGGSTGEEIDTALIEADAIDRRYPFQARKESRDAINAGTVQFHDLHISSLGDAVAHGQLVDPDIALVEAVAVGQDWLIPTTSIGHTSTYVRSADRLIVEINRAQPLELRHIHDVYDVQDPPNRGPIPLTTVSERIGDPKIRFDPAKLEAVVRVDDLDTPYTFKDISESEKRIGSHLATFLGAEIRTDPVLKETVNLQFGVGSIGNALMGQLDRIEFGDRTVNYFGEVIQDGLLDKLDGSPIESASATALALSSDGQKRFFDRIESYVSDIVLRPAHVSNNPGLIDRFGVVGINSALEVDIYGHVNATHINGTHLVNGIGGGGDFSRHSHIGIIALSSTAAGGDISRIVPMVPHVDHTEHDISIVITEQGIADLRGLGPRERATELITQCAHPTYKDELWSYLDRAEKSGGHIPHDLSIAQEFFHGQG